jgi:F-type H+-transporting ATPase subunit a
VAEGKVDPFTSSHRAAFRHRSLEHRGLQHPFTNSALWMAITAIVLLVFVGGGAKRQLVPAAGRWRWKG